jgi:hypothetical protein
MFASQGFLVSLYIISSTPTFQGHVVPSQACEVFKHLNVIDLAHPVSASFSCESLSKGGRIRIRHEPSSLDDASQYLLHLDTLIVPGKEVFEASLVLVEASSLGLLEIYLSALKRLEMGMASCLDYETQIFGFLKSLSGGYFPLKKAYVAKQDQKGMVSYLLAKCFFS